MVCKVILNRTSVEWPICQVLLTWYSTDFPLDKAKQYVKLRNPVLINDVAQQSILQDRREILRVLQEHNVPTPQHIVVSRTKAQVKSGKDPEGFAETADYVTMVLLYCLYCLCTCVPHMHVPLRFAHIVPSI